MVYTHQSRIDVTGLVMMTMRKHSIRCLRGLAFLIFVFAATSANSEFKDYTNVPLSELVELDIYAPSVLRSHLHEKGEWMLSYQFMSMRMEGNRDGTERVSSQDVLQQFMVAPTRMSMNMHMLNVMYAPSTDFTLMMMLGYLDKSMLHLTQAGGTFQTQSSGLGDVKVSVNQVISEAETTNAVHRFALTYGLSLPTGSIDEEDFLPAIATNARLPYPMQLGSGTVDPSIGALYLGYTSHYYWGTQIVATMRTGENDNGYRLGSRLELESWISRVWTDSVSTFARLSTNHSGNIHGADPTLNPMMVPTADPDRQAKTNVNLHLGFDFNIGVGKADDHTISVEITRPIYQDFDGPQLESEEIVRVGRQVVF